MPEGMPLAGWRVASLFLLMMIWWVSEAVPIPVTSLLPIILLPMAGIADIRTAAAPYASPIVVLLFGGFVIAKSVERWNLHTRIALAVVHRFGANPSAMVAGFMAAAAILSMWISNTATAIMLMPIALSVAASLGGEGWRSQPLSAALLLGIAYACSIGGVGTPIGTPTNLIVIGYAEAEFGRSVGFADWMLYGVPMVAILVPAAWLLLTRRVRAAVPEHRAEAAGLIEQARARLGPLSVPERRVSLAFAVIAVLWVFRRPLEEVAIADIRPFAFLTDHIIAVIGAVLLFLIPAGTGRREALLDWETAERIPWGVLLLFGGGLSLAVGMTESGLGMWMGEQLQALTALPLLLLIGALVLFVIFFTEIASNVATASALMPIVGAVAVGSGLDPMLMAMPVAVAASCAFMLPMATGPNAIAYASGAISMGRMARVGFAVNLAAIAGISLFSAWTLPLLL
ncbi:anion transporter [Pacificimonas flava]|uniref:Anion transporter n=2 Tax=Pacificimonas TaxID=1960290 RepID=A0A219B9B4_9SPHN|nr:anion transporter [Pacificimonas flava]